MYLKILNLSKYIVILFTLAGFSCSDDGLTDGVKLVHFPNSEIVKQYVEMKNGKKNGVLKEYYRNGHLKALQHYYNDTLTDTSFFYHENGNIGSYQILKKNRRVGCWKKFNKEGRRYWEACFKDDLLDGPAYEYSYRNLRIIKIMNFKKNRKDGKQEFFYPNGKPQSVSYYKDGSACPGTEEWNDKGKRIDHNFKINIFEKNEVLLKNTLSYIITLENPQKDDEVYIVSESNSGTNLIPERKLIKTGNAFVMEINLPKGSFVMKEIHLAAYRKTSMGNTVIKRTVVRASANSF
jgi:antitoxin component YwqK of YwqJK toxin-antitoxin module